MVDQIDVVADIPNLDVRGNEGKKKEVSDLIADTLNPETDPTSLEKAIKTVQASEKLSVFGYVANALSAVTSYIPASTRPERRQEAWEKLSQVESGLSPAEKSIFKLFKDVDRLGSMAVTDPWNFATAAVQLAEDTNFQEVVEALDERAPDVLLLLSYSNPAGAAYAAAAMVALKVAKKQGHGNNMSSALHSAEIEQISSAAQKIVGDAAESSQNYILRLMPLAGSHLGVSAQFIIAKAALEIGTQMSKGMTQNFEDLQALADDLSKIAKGEKPETFDRVIDYAQDNVFVLSYVAAIEVDNNWATDSSAIFREAARRNLITPLAHISNLMRGAPEFITNTAGVVWSNHQPDLSTDYDA